MWDCFKPDHQESCWVAASGLKSCHIYEIYYSYYGVENYTSETLQS